MQIPVLCSNCSAPLPLASFNSAEKVSCSSCGKKHQVEIFPAVLNPLRQGQLGENIRSDVESSCYYHSQKRAAAVCSSCGRFLCSLCEIDLAGRCLCPACLESGRQNESLDQLISERTLHDSIALAAAALPLFAWPLTLVTAPVALYLSITGWKKPRSLVRRNRIRLILAMLLSLAQIAGWVALAVAIIGEM